MGTMGSPFDAPLPRFQQAAAHLSSSLGQLNSKKPPLSPGLSESKSLKAYDERAERQVLAEFAQTKSLERNPSFTRRRNSRQDLNFPQANSLAAVLEHSSEAELVSLPSSSAPEMLLPKATSLLPAQSLLSPRTSFFSQRLPGILAATGMLLLLVMSIVALWPPSNGAHITPRLQSTLNEASFPLKVFNKLFGGGSTVHRLRMEQFTAAQGSGLGTVGFGLEDPTTSTDLTQPANDFDSFVSTHLGFESEDDFGSHKGQSRADFVAAFQRAEALNDDMSAHAGAYGEGLVAAALAAQGQAHPGTAEKPSIEGRKELEGDGSSSADTSTSTTAPVNSGGMSTGSNGGINGNNQAGTTVTGLSSAALNAQTNAGKKRSVGVIPQESVLPAGSDPLGTGYAGSVPSTSGTASSANTIAANPQTSSSTGSNGGTNTNTQLDSSTNSAVGSFSMGSSSSGSSSSTSSGNTPRDVPGKIAVEPFAGGTNTASSTSMGSTAVVGTNSGSSASGLRHKSAGQGRAGGTTASQTTPLDSMTSGQVTSVASSDLSSSQTTGQRGLVGENARSSFQPLSGRKLRSGRRLLFS